MHGYMADLPEHSQAPVENPGFQGSSPRQGEYNSAHRRPGSGSGSGSLPNQHPNQWTSGNTLAQMPLGRTPGSWSSSHV